MDKVTFLLQVLSILIPVLLSLALIWIRHWYLQKVERNTKQESLWRSFQEEMEYIPSTIKEIGRVGTAYSDHKVRIISFHVSRIQLEIANRLVVLDPRHAVDYGYYVDCAELVEKGFEFFRELILQKLIIDNSLSENIRKAIKYQAISLQKDLIEMCNRQVKILELLASETNKFDKQIAVSARQTYKMLLADNGRNEGEGGNMALDLYLSIRERVFAIVEGDPPQMTARFSQ